jgi:hypothetical protein
VVDPGIPGPSDGHLAGHRLGVVGDHDIGFPTGHAVGALGFVVVADADHIAGFQEPCRYALADQIASHELPRRSRRFLPVHLQDACVSAFGYLHEVKIPQTGRRGSPLEGDAGRLNRGQAGVRTNWMRESLMRSRTYDITFVGHAGPVLAAVFDDCQVTTNPSTTTLRTNCLTLTP